MKFKIGDRVIVDGKSGTIVTDDFGPHQVMQTNQWIAYSNDGDMTSSNSFFYRVTFDDKPKSAIRYWHEEIQLDVARIRDEKLKDIL